MATLARLLALASLMACGPSSPPPPADAGVTPDAQAILIAPPASPARPAIPPCAPGWREETNALASVPVCRPWPASGPATCAAHEAHFPGEPGCVRVGTACAVDGWPSDLPAGSVVLHVRAGATGGDGTRAAPFGAIADATAIATPGAIVALAEGTYDEDVSLGEAVTLWGACPERTIVLSSTVSPFPSGAITSSGAGASVKNLSIVGGTRAGLWVAGAGRSLSAEDVVIRGVGWVGVNAESGATFDARRLVIRDLPGAPETGMFGRGLTIESGSTATVEQLVVERAREFGAISLGAGTVTVLRDAVVRETLGRTNDGAGGVGIAAFDGGRVEGERVVAERNREAGIFANRAGAAVELTHAVVSDTQPNVELSFGSGANAQLGASFTCSKCTFERNVGTSVFSGGEGSTLELSDVVVLETRPDALRGGFGRGVNVQLGAVAHLARVVVAANRETGILIGGAGATGELVDVRVTGTASEESTGLFGRGIAIQSGASASLVRVAVEMNAELGVFASEPDTHADFEDLLVRAIGPQAIDDRLGRGVLAQNGAAVSLLRARVESTREVGVSAFGTGSLLEARDLVVSNVLAQACAETTCTRDPGGHGVAAYAGARLVAERFSVEGAALCGVHVATDGTAMLVRGSVAGCAIGACLQSEAQALADLTDDVAYRDNDATLDSTTLPVPAAVGVATER